MMMLYVLAFLYSNGELLLVRRSAHASFGANEYSLVGGKVEPGESALHGIQREVLEETGLHIAITDFHLVHTIHRLGTEGPFVALCFKADISGMYPENKEPEKHDDMRLFNIMHGLPEDILPAHKQIIDCIMHKVYYSEHGW